MGATCSACGSLFVPPRSVCSKCYGSEMEWTAVKGVGRLVAFTCIGIGPAFMAQEGYDRDNPYCAGVVELAEKARVVARIEGVNAREPETIAVGTAMRVKFLHRGGEENSARTFLAFEPID